MQYLILVLINKLNLIKIKKNYLNLGAGYPCAGQRIDISEFFEIVIIFVLCGTLGAVLETGSI